MNDERREFLMKALHIEPNEFFEDDMYDEDMTEDEIFCYHVEMFFGHVLIMLALEKLSQAEDEGVTDSAALKEILKPWFTELLAKDAISDDQLDALFEYIALQETME